jgi:zinc transport system ATP-binding protein
LSGGQQQRVLLARALGAAGQILLMDEPTAGLDPKAAAELYALIKSLNDSGVTVILISHDIDAAVKYASHILHIGMGASLFFGTAADYLKSETGRVFARLEGGQT